MALKEETPLKRKIQENYNYQSRKEDAANSVYAKVSSNGIYVSKMDFAYKKGDVFMFTLFVGDSYKEMKVGYNEKTGEVNKYVMKKAVNW